MAVNFPDINKKAYGMDGGYKSNRKKITFESGKERYYLLNSSPVKTFKFKLKLVDDKTENCEFRIFLNWYATTLLSGTQTFMFPDLTGKAGEKEYRLTSEPTWTGQKYKEITLNVEEE